MKLAGLVGPPEKSSPALWCLVSIATHDTGVRTWHSNALIPMISVCVWATCQTGARSDHYTPSTDARRLWPVWTCDRAECSSLLHSTLWLFSQGLAVGWRVVAGGDTADCDDIPAFLTSRGRTHGGIPSTFDAYYAVNSAQARRGE